MGEIGKIHGLSFRSDFFDSSLVIMSRAQAQSLRSLYESAGFSKSSFWSVDYVCDQAGRTVKATGQPENELFAFTRRKSILPPPCRIRKNNFATIVNDLDEVRKKFRPVTAR